MDIFDKAKVRHVLSACRQVFIPFFWLLGTRKKDIDWNMTLRLPHDVETVTRMRNYCNQLYHMKRLLAPNGVNPKVVGEIRRTVSRLLAELGMAPEVLDCVGDVYEAVVLLLDMALVQYATMQQMLLKSRK